MQEIQKILASLFINEATVEVDTFLDTALNMYPNQFLKIKSKQF